MSEKGNPVISQHDVESCVCLVYNECIKSAIDSTNESPLLSERKYTPPINQKTLLSTIIESNHGDECMTDLNSIPNLISASMKSTMEQDSLINNNQINIPPCLSLPLTSKICSKNVASDMELTIPSVTSLVTLSSVTQTGDIVIGELPNVEEWLKLKSDSLSSLDFDAEMKTEIDMTDFLSPNGKSLSTNLSNNTSSNSNIAIDHNSKLGNDVGIYNSENVPSSSGFIQNSFSFESDGSLSSSLSANGCDVSRNKTNMNNINMIKKIDSLVQVEKGLFEEMLLTDSFRKNFKMKDSIIGDEKGLFEELLMPGVQEWLLTVSSSDKKDCISAAPIDSVSVPQSPSPSVLPVNDHNETSNKDTFDEYDIIERNINTLKLMTPQEIENMPSRSLGFDDGQFKEEIGDDHLDDLPFHSCEDKELPDLPSGSNNDVDHKLFNILAMDASNDTLDNNNFSENILDSIDPEPRKIIDNDISNENFICNIDSKSLDTDSLLKNNVNVKKVPQEINNFSSIRLKNEKAELNIASETPLNTKAKESIEKNKPLNYILADSSSSIKPVLSNNIKILTKHSSNNFNKDGNDIVSPKNKSLSIGVVHLKLSSKHQGAASCIEKKSGVITTLPQILIKPGTIQSQEPVTLPVTEAECNVINACNLSNTVRHSAGNVLPVQNVAGIAKVNICVDCKANTTNVSIISSNKEHTVFKINTSDLMRAVLSIKEVYLEPLGLKNQQLVETANAAHKLLSVHSHFSYLKKNNEDGSLKSPQTFEINQYIQEIKTPVLRSCATLSNVGHILTATKVSEASPKNKIFSKIDSGNVANVTNTFHMKKLEAKSSQIKKLVIEKPRGHGENVGISLLPGAPPTMVSVPSVLDALSGPSTSKVNIAQVLAGCELTAADNKSETKEGQQDNNTSDEKTNNALIQLGINPNSLSPSIGPKGNKRWQCPIASCTKQFPKLSYLKVHILNHKGIRPYKCSYENCDWSFYTSYKLKRHLETHLKRRDFVCTEPDCSRRFTTIYNLNTHMTLHKKPKAWVCSLLSCGKAFHMRRELEAHMKLHTDVKPPYKCSVEGCFKAYFTPNSLASHMRSHHKEEDLRCQWVGCEKRFDKPCRLRAHMRVHTGQRPYVCTFEGCNWRFQCASKLSRHQRKHTNDRKYSCPICKKAFLRSEHLKGHLLTHTGVRNFQCPIANCEAKFTAKSSLYVHLKKHKAQKADVKLPCPFDACEKSYDSKLNLRQHLLKNHTQILSADSSHLDYITLVSDKELNDQLLPQSLTSFEASKPTFSSFGSFSLQSASVEAPSTALEVNSTSEKEVGTLPNGSVDSSLVGPLLAVSSASTLSESQSEPAVLSVAEGLYSFGEGDSSHASTELGFPDLPPKEVSATAGSKGLIFHGGSAARTDVLGNIILSQRAKRRQQLSMARKMAATTEISKANYCHDLILSTAVGDSLPLSSHFQPSIIQDDGISCALYEDTLITRDMISDPTSDPQSTINLRDLE